MKIELLDLTVREIVEDYDDAGEGGVTGYGGKLDIRPPFQREFIYNDKERNAVIDSILKGFPLNVMYWSDRENGEYEIIDGQQRTISVAQYVDGDFSFNNQYFHNLPSDKARIDIGLRVDGLRLYRDRQRKVRVVQDYKHCGQGVDPPRTA